MLVIESIASGEIPSDPHPVAAAETNADNDDDDEDEDNWGVARMGAWAEGEPGISI